MNTFYKGRRLDSYKTIKKNTIFEQKIKGSKFIAQAFPVQEKDQAESVIAQICKQYYDATHNCFAYRIGVGQDEIFRYNDDGEPSGTAGKPILQAIDSQNLTDVLVIVTRYFGGTKLGTGGLIRSYGGTAQLLLEQTEIEQKYLYTKLHLNYDYSLTQIILNTLEKYHAKIVNSDYSDTVTMDVKIRNSMVEMVQKQLVEITAGKAEISLEG